MTGEKKKFYFFEEALLKRRAQASTVIVFKSSDPKRLSPFVKIVLAYFESKKKTCQVFLYKVWSGLFRISVSPDGNLKYEPVSMTAQQQSSPLAQLAGVAGDNRITDLSQALQYLDDLMRAQKNIVAIFWGLFQKKGNPQEYDNLNAFLRNVIFSDEYYVNGHIITVFTESPEDIIDEGTLKHSIYIEIPPSTDEERREILEQMARDLNINTNNIDALVEATKGLNLHEVESVALESFFRFRKLDPRAMTAFKYDIVRKSGILDIGEPKYGFEAVGGYDVLKEFIRNNIIKVLRNPKKAEKLGIRPPRGILLFGAAGTGKTHFARALAKELGIPFLRLRTEKIVSKWYGQTSRNIAKAIEIAESVAPCVLFIDEIDRFGRRGHITEHEESRRAFSILLEWLGDERRKTIVIGATNRPEDLDEAFRRVGRFDYLIPVLYPDLKARIEILKVHTSVIRKVPLAEDVDLKRIAEMTELFSGAELEELVLRAARNALKEDRDIVTMDDFMKALKTFRINFEQRRQQLERYLRLAEEYTNDAEFLENLRKSTKTRLDVMKEELR